MGHIAATVPEDSFSEGGLGLSADPEQPETTPDEPSPKIQGGIDKETIRRVVRKNIEDVRGCYEQGLAKDPTLEGRVSIRFTILADGVVGSSEIVSSGTMSQGVSDCIRDALKTWTFPKPKGGVVVVTYPFMLLPG